MHYHHHATGNCMYGCSFPRRPSSSPMARARGSMVRCLWREVEAVSLMKNHDHTHESRASCVHETAPTTIERYCMIYSTDGYSYSTSTWYRTVVPVQTVYSSSVIYLSTIVCQGVRYRGYVEWISLSLSLHSLESNKGSSTSRKRGFTYRICTCLYGTPD